nr:50S ribosomal protein L27 [Candidatus Saccharibacteria bacterium]
MSKTKAGGSVKNVHDSPGQRLGVKRFGGEKVKTGA